MKKIIFSLIIYTLSINLCYADDKIWCGTYFEDKGKGYLRVSTKEYTEGSFNCSLSNHQSNLVNFGSSDLVIDFKYNNSALSNWKNFSNHLIMVKGNFDYGIIRKPKLISNIAYNKNKVEKLEMMVIAKISLKKQQ